MIGASVQISFEIVDRRRILGDETVSTAVPPRYDVTLRSGRKVLFKQTCDFFCPLPSFYYVKLVISADCFGLLLCRYQSAGVYTMTVPSPPSRQLSTLVVEMVNEHGQLFCDSFGVYASMILTRAIARNCTYFNNLLRLVALSFNVHFFRLLKWLLAIPFTVMAGALLLSDSVSGKSLPLSF